MSTWRTVLTWEVKQYGVDDFPSGKVVKIVGSTFPHELAAHYIGQMGTIHNAGYWSKGLLYINVEFSDGQIFSYYPDDLELQ